MILGNVLLQQIIYKLHRRHATQNKHMKKAQQSASWLSHKKPTSCRLLGNKETTCNPLEKLAKEINIYGLAHTQFLFVSHKK